MAQVSEHNELAVHENPTPIGDRFTVVVGDSGRWIFSLVNPRTNQWLWEVRLHGLLILFSPTFGSKADAKEYMAETMTLSNAKVHKQR